MSAAPTDTRPPERAGLPAGNLYLPDGRFLRYCERESWEQEAVAASYGLRGPWRVWQTTERAPFLVTANLERLRRGGLVLHVSMSYKKRYPTWDEIKQVKRLFYGPDRDVMQLLPREAKWVNLQPNCFHLYECPDAWEVL